MEEKNHEIRSCLRAVFSFGNAAKSFFRTGHYSKNSPAPLLIKSKGFTLVEIIVVVGILGILITGLISLINPSLQIQKSRDARRKSDIRQIQSALELYRADCGFYPDDSSFALLPTLSSSCTGSPVVYMQSVPKDPNGTNYYYDRTSTQTYRLRKCIENANDVGEGVINDASCPPSNKAYEVLNP